MEKYEAGLPVVRRKGRVVSEPLSGSVEPLLVAGPLTVRSDVGEPGRRVRRLPPDRPTVPQADVEVGDHGRLTGPRCPREHRQGSEGHDARDRVGEDGSVAHAASSSRRENRGGPPKPRV